MHVPFQWMYRLGVIIAQVRAAPEWEEVRSMVMPGGCGERKV